MKKMLVTAAALAAAGMLLLPMLIAGMTLTLAGSAAARCLPGADGGTIGDLTADLPSQIGTWSGDQVVNAAHIITAGQNLNLDRKTVTIGVMTAMGESSLIVVDYGDSAGPDSRGLFQQRANGAWGSYSDRMDPVISATNFFKALITVPNYRDLEPTIAAHRTQRNQDPYHYRPFWDDAVKVVNTLTGDGQDLTDPLDPLAAPEDEDQGDRLVWPVGKNVPHGAVYNQAGPHWASGHHTGFDFNPPAGTPVHAAHAGTVTESSGDVYPYGISVVITWKQGADTWSNRYAHLMSRTVEKGDTVAAGEIVGKVGWTGNVIPKGPAGAHLHFELVINGAHTDPLAWLQGKAVDPGPGDGAPMDCPAPAPPGWTGEIPPVDREANRAALEFALSQIGQPYAPGGGTGPAYGCNGFAWRAWHEAGSGWPLMLADEQGTTGRWVTEIPKTEAQPGDLVLTWYANGTDTSAGVRWDHVGLVVDPDKGTYVNAANSRPYPAGGVKMSDWDDYTGPRIGFARVHMT